MSLDAGNVVIFLDHDRLARLTNERGFDVRAERLIETEGEAKLLTATPERMMDVSWAQRALPGAAPWGRTVATVLALAGVPKSKLPELLSFLWASHVVFNLWSVVPEGFRQSIEALRATGVKTALVSNSEGMLNRLFLELGIRDLFDVFLDSGVVGVEKPEPRIFAMACEQAGRSPEAALHLGDTYTTDIVGAERAGMRRALIDPRGHYEGMFPEVPRVSGVVDVCRDMLALRG